MDWLLFYEKISNKREERRRGEQMKEDKQGDKREEEGEGEQEK